MATLGTLVKEFITSVGDPRAPVKKLLGDFWDQALPPRDQKDLLVDALLEAINQETGEGEVVWTRAEVDEILTQRVDSSLMNLENLDSGQLGQELEKAFSTIAVVPSRSVDRYDFEQIARNVVLSASAKLERKLQQPENQNLLGRLMREQSRRTGQTVGEIKRELFGLSAQMTGVQKSIGAMKEKMDELNRTLQSISETRSALRSRQTAPTKRLLLSAVDRASMRTRLGELEDNVRVIKESWAKYVSERDIPLQQQKDLRTIQRRINELRKNLGLPKTRW